MDHEPETHARRSWFAPAAAVVLVLTVLSSLQPFGPTVLRAASGLVLGSVMVAIAAWINRREGCRRFVADGTLVLGALATGGLFGTGFIFLPLLDGLLADSPQTLPTILQPPLGINLSIYYFVANPLLETVIIPLALLTNWHTSRRRTPLIMTALVFYGMRAWTYLYFAPIFMGLAVLPAGQPFSPAILEQISQFTNLSWVRLFIDGLTCVGFLLALRACIPVTRRSGPATPGP
ncbi:MAG: hypothetical protein M3R63_01880 [Actinomycetota bacterium]|nr:hypothetical protein [Actinomycetota bacterium]